MKLRSDAKATRPTDKSRPVKKDAAQVFGEDGAVYTRSQAPGAATTGSAAAPSPYAFGVTASLGSSSSTLAAMYPYGHQSVSTASQAAILAGSLAKDGSRPPGYVGAYSAEQRKMRVDKFLEKRGKRVWSRKVKYDVRKNFADSRLRIKVSEQVFCVIAYFIVNRFAGSFCEERRRGHDARVAEHYLNCLMRLLLPSVMSASVCEVTMVQFLYIRTRKLVPSFMCLALPRFP